MKQYRILVINPGSTSTKVAVYQKKDAVFEKTVRHEAKDLDDCGTMMAQIPLRKACVMEAMREHGIAPETLDAIAARGGLLPPIPGGGHRVDERMVQLLMHGKLRQHASNLGALIAYEIAQPLGIQAYIYDAVSSDEMLDVARLTGYPGVERRSFCHTLNAKASARKVAADLGKRYEQMNFVVAHIGGGVSISAHCHGRILDVVGDDEGPFTPQRAGNLPQQALVKLCYQSGLTEDAMEHRLKNDSGMRALLGTDDFREIEQRIMAGEKKTIKVCESYLYALTKKVGEMASVLGGRLDAVILTGGMACSSWIEQGFRQRCNYLAPVYVVPGEREMEALALGVLRVLNGEETAPPYDGPIEGDFRN